MTFSEADEEWIESGLETLYQDLAKIKIMGYSQVREYIDVGEFGLALDLIAHSYIKSGMQPSPEGLKLVNALGARMGMRDGDEWRGVAQLRKPQ